MKASSTHTPNNNPEQTIPGRKQLTPEQQAIINTNGNARINAVAGSGKTSTLLEYAATRPANAAILYLAFNKSVKLEAIRKFKARGLHNVKVETAHSLAYSHIMNKSNFKIKTGGYKIYEIAELLGLRGNNEKHTEYIIANHINKFITFFCNSDKLKVQELNYLDIVTDPKALKFARTFYQPIENGTRQILSMMDKGELEVIHDFYLKKFQLSQPQLAYDYILFDEAQDASAAMLDVFLRQKAIKIIVGDTNQQIYGWRHAVNSLEKTDFPQFQLSNSFRFHQPIADLAKEILEWKNHFGEYKAPIITGSGKSIEEKSKATIARTNLGLLLNAIDYITDNPKVQHIYFEGNIHSYTYAEEGASLYDVLHLENNRNFLIRDKLIKSMKNMKELEDYIEKTEDIQLGMMVKIVKEYGNEIPSLLKSLKELHTGDENRDKAEMIFSTVHRAKGMEYDIVYLVNDFIKEGDLTKTKKEKTDDVQNPAKLNEEINLLYVSVTRTKNQLHIPQALLPKSYPESPHIKVVVPPKKETENDPLFSLSKDYNKPFTNRKSKSELKEKAFTYDKKREKFKDAYRPWTPELDDELKVLFESDNPISAIATHFGRTKGAVIARLKKMNYFES